MSTIGKIGDLLHHKGTQVWSITPDAMVFDAIQMMAEKNIGALLVLDKGKLVGIISERDYTRKVALKGRSSKESKVREIIGGEVVKVTSQHSVEHCMRLMTEHHVRHLPVLDADRIAGSGSIS